MVDIYGMIPNGNRVYFSKRTQPPLFIAMVDAYFEVCDYNNNGIFAWFSFRITLFNFHFYILQKTQDLVFVEELIDKMETEFMFWIENRMTTVIFGDEEHSLANYISNVSYPRPGNLRQKNCHVFQNTKCFI